MLAVLPNRFRSAGRLRNLSHIRLVVDDSSDAFPNEVVIVNGHYSDNVVGIHLAISKSCRLAPIRNTRPQFAAAPRRPWFTEKVRGALLHGPAANCFVLMAVTKITRT